jgi:peptidyl-prolyl cis-trans isomerase C
VRHASVLIAITFCLACSRTPAASENTAAKTAAQAPTASPSTAPGAAGAAPASQPPGQGQAPAAPAVKPVPASLPDIVARVNGEACSRGELERAIKNVEGRAGRPVPPEQRDQVYRGVLDELVAFKLVQAEGKVRGIAVTDEEIDARVANIRGTFKTDAEFQEALKGRQMTLADLRHETRSQILVNKTMEAELAPKATVTQQDLEAYYQQNPARFKAPEQVRASHILFSIDTSATADFKQATRTQAEAVLKRARAGEDFAGLAKEFSKDSSASAGGDLNYFPRGQMVPAFEQAAFALKTGEISGIVESPFGLHIIKVTDHKPERTVPLAEVSERLGQFLKQQKQQQLMQQFVESLKAKFKVEVLI